MYRELISDHWQNKSEGGVILPADLEYELLLKTYHQGSKPVKAA
jgi:hypothetical protein